MKVIDHPAHSRDQAPSDFHFVFAFKETSGRPEVSQRQEVKNEVAAWLLVQAVKFCDIGIQKLKPWLNKCLDKSGDYGEKWLKAYVKRVFTRFC